MEFYQWCILVALVPVLIVFGWLLVPFILAFLIIVFGTIALLVAEGTSRLGFPKLKRKLYVYIQKKRWKWL